MSGRGRFISGVGARVVLGVLGLVAITLPGCAHRPNQPAGSAVPAPPMVMMGAGGVAGSETATVNPGGPQTDLTFWKGRTDLLRPPAPPVAAELTLPPVERWRLPNGLDVVAVPRAGLPIVSFTVAIKAGSYDEQKDVTEGVADFTAGMLRQGTRRRSAEQIADAIDAAGGSLDAAAGAESSTVSCSALAKDAALCLDLLGELLLHPTFPEKEMAQIRDQMLASLAAREDDPHLLAAEHFDNLFFGEGHPEGWVLTPQHVRAITRARLVAFWKTFYRPNNAMLAVAGALPPDIKARIAHALGGWAAAPTPARPAFTIPAPRGTRILLVDKPDLSQATLMFGHRSLRHADPDWYAVTLMNYVLGGSDFSSRLMIEVRSKRGLTYGIGSSFGASLYEGAFRVSAATRNETAWDALRVSVDELRKMRADGPTADELEKAKGYYAGSTPFALESAAGLARGIVGAELHGLGVDYVRQLAVRLAAVDVAAAHAAARKWLDPDHLAIVIVGRAAVIAPQIGKAGLPFEQIDFRAPISSAARQAAASSAPAPVRAPAR